MKKKGREENRKASYRELEALCLELEARVTRGIMVQQELISLKAELDQELNRFRLIQEFGELGLFRESIQEFGALATEYFIRAFEQPHALLAEYDEKSDMLAVVSTFGFANTDVPAVLPLSPADFPEREGFLLSQQPDTHVKLASLDLEEALAGPLFGPDGAFKGFVVCGQQRADQRFYNPIDTQARHSFTVMATKVSYLLHNFRINQQLKQEIEERRRVEQMLEEKAAELLRSNSELEQFAYVVSHDLKAPLRNVLGFAGMLQKKWMDAVPEAGREYLEIILKEINRFGAVIDGLLAYARFSSRPPRERQLVDFNKLAEKVQAQIYLAIQQCRAVIKVHPLPSLPADPQQMEQLFQNLITNAIKFTPSGRRPEIDISAKPSGSEYCFTIRDNGIGIEEHNLESIFGLFQRPHASRGYEGSGLGLSICRKIVGQHQGRIWAESKGPGQGAAFRFTLPCR